MNVISRGTALTAYRVSRLAGTALALLAGLATGGMGPLRAAEPGVYDCRTVDSPLRIDGRLDDEGWLHAEFSGPLVDIVDGSKAMLDARVALLWDDRCLYVAYRLAEPNVRADLTERDSLIWQENDVELFIAGKDAYYELELNARNTVYEVFWIWKDALVPGSPYFGRPEFDPVAHRVMTLDGVGGHRHPRGERWGFLDWDLPGLRSAVHVDGTVNDPADRDAGWTVELALPWKGLQDLSDGRPLPPEPGDVWRIDCSRFQRYAPDGSLLEPSRGWTWKRHGFYDSHIPEAFTPVRFVDGGVGGNPSPPRDSQP